MACSLLGDSLKLLPTNVTVVVRVGEADEVIDRPPADLQSELVEDGVQLVRVEAAIVVGVDVVELLPELSALEEHPNVCTLVRRDVLEDLLPFHAEAEFRVAVKRCLLEELMERHHAITPAQSADLQVLDRIVAANMMAIRLMNVSGITVVFDYKQHDVFVTMLVNKKSKCKIASS